MLEPDKIGCCGTCREFLKTCRGCKPGYLDGTRDLRRAKCKMKKCCLTHGHCTCADCKDYDSCETLQGFFAHTGYKYGKYRQALEYIRAHGCPAFLQVAQNWTGAYGRYPNQKP